MWEGVSVINDVFMGGGERIGGMRGIREIGDQGNLMTRDPIILSPVYL